MPWPEEQLRECTQQPWEEQTLDICCTSRSRQPAELQDSLSALLGFINSSLESAAKRGVGQLSADRAATRNQHLQRAPWKEPWCLWKRSVGRIYSEGRENGEDCSTKQPGLCAPSKLMGLEQGGLHDPPLHQQPPAPETAPLRAGAEHKLGIFMLSL